MEFSSQAARQAAVMLRCFVAVVSAKGEGGGGTKS